MPKYCTAPNCKNDSGNTNSERKSFYKFPLHDPERLQFWLKNMGREDWTPSRHQYLCHEHFLPSCFTLRWGIRYLDSNAVPTIFNLSEINEKRKGVDRFERRAKRQRYNRKPGVVLPDVEVLASDATGETNEANTVQLYTITVDPSQPGEPVLLDTSNIGDTVGTLQTALPLPVLDGIQGPGGDFPVTLLQTVEDAGGTGGGEHEEVMVVFENPSSDEGDEVEVTSAATLTDSQEIVVSDGSSQVVPDPSSLVIENVAVEMEEPNLAQEDNGVQLIAYFETIPSSASAQVNISQDMVLSSSLSSKPIVSTLPIVSKHMPPSPGSLVLTLERLETVNDEGKRDALEEDSAEQQGKQLEEHRYHKNSLSKEQLEAIVTELQKKVKVLQQRHRRHLDKLLGLESTVSQLRQSNLLNEERLQLLERAYMQTSAVVSDAGETVAIIYEEDNTAYLYAQPKTEEEEGLD